MDAGEVCNTAIRLVSFKQVPAEGKQKYPFGQQCTPSLQQSACGSGQQPHSPEELSQHVWVLGHSDSPSGQTTLSRIFEALTTDNLGRSTEGDFPLFATFTIIRCRSLLKPFFKDIGDDAERAGRV